MNAEEDETVKVVKSPEIGKKRALLRSYSLDGPIGLGGKKAARNRKGGVKITNVLLLTPPVHRKGK